MMLGSDGATAIAPIDPVGWLSKSGTRWIRKSVDRHTPPLSKPM
jgi:hypothetical protein